MTATPNPGSNEAIVAGCLCPILDNGHGHGYMGRRDVFVLCALCPIHGGSRRKRDGATKKEGGK